MQHVIDVTGFMCLGWMSRWRREYHQQQRKKHNDSGCERPLGSAGGSDSFPVWGASAHGPGVDHFREPPRPLPGSAELRVSGCVLTPIAQDCGGAWVVAAFEGLVSWSSFVLLLVVSSKMHSDWLQRCKLTGCCKEDHFEKCCPISNRVIETGTSPYCPTGVTAGEGPRLFF